MAAIPSLPPGPIRYTPLDGSEGSALRDAAEAGLQPVEPWHCPCLCASPPRLRQVLVPVLSHISGHHTAQVVGPTQPFKKRSSGHLQLSGLLAALHPHAAHALAWPHPEQLEGSSHGRWVRGCAGQESTGHHVREQACQRHFPQDSMTLTEKTANVH